MNDDDPVEVNQIIYFIFSNLCTPMNAYNWKMGSVKESIDYLVKYCLMPFDQQTILILNVFEELIDW